MCITCKKYLKVTIIYRYIFGRFRDYYHFAGINFLLFSLVTEMTNNSIVMLRRLQASETFVCVYKILRFCANPQKFQTLVPTKNSHLKVYVNSEYNSNRDTRLKLYFSKKNTILESSHANIRGWTLSVTFCMLCFIPV